MMGRSISLRSLLVDWLLPVLAVIPVIFMTTAITILSVGPDETPSPGWYFVGFLYVLVHAVYGAWRMARG